LSVADAEQQNWWKTVQLGDTLAAGSCAESFYWWHHVKQEIGTEWRATGFCIGNNTFLDVHQ